MESTDDFQSLSQSINSCTSAAMAAVLSDKVYQAAKTGEWIDELNGRVLEECKAASASFKFIVSSIIIQKVGAGFHLESVAHWDAVTDGLVVCRFETGSFTAICTVAGVAI